MDLYEELTRLMNELTVAISRLKKNGENLAIAERDYKITLREEALKLRADGTPVTLINQIIYGVKSVADKQFTRDVAEAVYEANKEFINVTKLKLRILEGQISREYGIAGKGEI